MAYEARGFSTIFPLASQHYGIREGTYPGQVFSTTETNRSIVSVKSIIELRPKLRSQIPSDLVQEAPSGESMRDHLLELLVPIQAKHPPDYCFEAGIVSSQKPGATESDLNSIIQSILLHAVVTVDAEMACMQDVASIGIRWDCMKPSTKRSILRVFWDSVSQRNSEGADKDVKSGKQIDEDQIEELLCFALKLAGGPIVVWKLYSPICRTECSLAGLIGIV